VGIRGAVVFEQSFGRGDSIAGWCIVCSILTLGCEWSGGFLLRVTIHKTKRNPALRPEGVSSREGPPSGGGWAC